MKIIKGGMLGGVTAVGRTLVGRDADIGPYLDLFEAQLADAAATAEAADGGGGGGGFPRESAFSSSSSGEERRRILERYLRGCNAHTLIGRDEWRYAEDALSSRGGGGGGGDSVDDEKLVHPADYAIYLDVNSLYASSGKLKKEVAQRPLLLSPPPSSPPPPLTLSFFPKGCWRKGGRGGGEGEGGGKGKEAPPERAP